MRAHLYKAITNNAGDLQSAVVVRLLQPDALPDEAVSLVDPVYDTKTGGTDIGPTFTVTDGVIDVWLDVSQYVMLGLTPTGLVEYFIDNVPVLAPLTITGTAVADQVLTADGPDSAHWATP